ncbi:MAG: WbqC family protein [Bacteroidia bacterium]|jgi:hypothetical protein|nr:WbqC family protein [Bacteroidia bacterium]
MSDDAAIFSLPLLGPVQWYSKWLLHDEIVIDIAGHYVKQTWRNRYRIDGANGTQDLSIPVILPASKSAQRDVRIDMHNRWNLQHWRAIQSAYGKSPYFEFYADHFARFYTSPLPHRLIDFSIPLLDLSLKLLKWNRSYRLMEVYEPHPEGKDYRLLIAPKIHHETDSEFLAKPYTQVFSDRFPFRPNLSVIDLLCCTGPSAGEYIKQSIHTR